MRDRTTIAREYQQTLAALGEAQVNRADLSIKIRKLVQSLLDLRYEYALTPAPPPSEPAKSAPSGPKPVEEVPNANPV